MFSHAARLSFSLFSLSISLSRLLSLALSFLALALSLNLSRSLSLSHSRARSLWQKAQAILAQQTGKAEKAEVYARQVAQLSGQLSLEKANLELMTAGAARLHPKPPTIKRARSRSHPHRQRQKKIPQVGVRVGMVCAWSPTHFTFCPLFLLWELAWGLLCASTLCASSLCASTQAQRRCLGAIGSPALQPARAALPPRICIYICICLCIYVCMYVYIYECMYIYV